MKWHEVIVIPQLRRLHVNVGKLTWILFLIVKDKIFHCIDGLSVIVNYAYNYKISAMLASHARPSSVYKYAVGFSFTVVLI